MNKHNIWLIALILPGLVHFILLFGSVFIVLGSIFYSRTSLSSLGLPNWLGILLMLSSIAGIFVIFANVRTIWFFWMSFYIDAVAEHPLRLIDYLVMLASQFGVVIFRYMTNDVHTFTSFTLNFGFMTLVSQHIGMTMALGITAISWGVRGILQNTDAAIRAIRWWVSFIICSVVAYSYLLMNPAGNGKELLSLLISSAVSFTCSLPFWFKNAGGFFQAVEEMNSDEQDT